MAKENSSVSKDLVRYHFDNVQELVVYCENMGKKYKAYQDRLISFACKDVYKTMPTASELHNKAFAGCRELYEKHFSKSEFTLETSGGKKIEYQNDITGMYVDVGAYLQGVPECFIDEVLTEDSCNRFADIVINVGAPSDIKNDKIIEKLKGVVGLIDHYENIGIRCSVSICSKAVGSSYGHASYDFFLKIKNHEQPLNIEQLVFIAGSPIALRYFMLLAAANHAGDTSGNYITCGEHDKEMIADESIVYIPSMYYDMRNRITDYSNIINTYNLNVENILI